MCTALADRTHVPVFDRALCHAAAVVLVDAVGDTELSSAAVFRAEATALHADVRLISHIRLDPTRLTAVVATCYEEQERQGSQCGDLLDGGHTGLSEIHRTQIVATGTIDVKVHPL